MAAVKKSAKPRRGAFSGFIVKAIFAAFIIWSIASIVSVQAANAEKREELQRLQAYSAELEEENAELQRLLNFTDDMEYIERLATEEYGYSYPGERRFYDISGN